MSDDEPVQEEASEEDDSPRDLKPARPDAHVPEGSSFGPRIPWLWILVVVGGIGLVFTSYYVRRDQRQDALRNDMLTLHSRELGELSERYLAYRQRIEQLAMDAAAEGEPETFVHENLNLAGLRDADGLYLRIPADFADTAARVEGAALAMSRDAITRCLGLEPMSARGLYESGYFLTPEWLDSVRTEESMMQLRVFEDQLGRHIQVDAPVVVTMMRAQWFMLIIQRGERRDLEPVDVFLWDIRNEHETLLLSARIQGRGILVPARIAFEGVDNPAPPGRPALQSGAAADCSIASQIRGLTGHEEIEFQSSEALLEARRREDEANPPEGEPSTTDEVPAPDAPTASPP